MDVNYEVWGQSEEWRDASSYTYYGLGDFKRPKEGVNSYYNAYSNGSLVGGEVPTDLSLAFWGIGEGSILTKPMFLASYWDGDAIKTVAEPINDDEVSNVPCILGYGSDGEGQYTLSWWNRYAPADNPGEAEWSTSSVINIWSMYREIFTSFNYQKVMLVPFVRVALGSPTDSWGETYVSLKQYMDGMVAGGQYANYNKILAIGYQLAIGDGNSNRSTNNKELSFNLPVNIKGSSRHWEGVKNNRQRDWLWFATEYGINTMLDSGMLNPGSYSYARSITPYRRLSAVDFTSLHTIGDGETGLCYKYCMNYKEPSDTGYGQVHIPYYYDPDNEIWKINDSLPWNTDYADPFPYIECTTTNKNAVRDYILKQIAYLGFPFVYDPSMATRGKIGDIGVYLPVFDDDGITTGNYEEGSKALELPNAEWVDGREGSGYDPTKPSGGGEDTGDDGVEVRPSNPAFTLAGRGTQCYAITPADMTEIFTDIYGRSKGSFQDLTEGLALFGSDPMGAIISYKWYPFNFEPNTNASIVLGTTEINPSHTYPIIQNVLSSMKNFKGSFRLKADRDFINSRATQARLYLPFYGFYELPMPQLISHELEIEFHYNVPDELATWIISWNNVIYDFVECDPAIEIPLTGTNARAIRSAKVQAALNIAATVAQTAATIGIGVASFSTGIAAAAGGAMGAAQVLGEQGALAWGKQVATASTRATNFSTGAGIVGALANGYNGLTNAVASVNRLKVNVPFHPASDSTTFLNLSMVPYLQLYTNQPIVDYSGNGDAPKQYKLKVGIACDKWVTTDSMPDESLLKTTGIANMDINGMELSEVQELNGILQSGFYK